MRALPLYGSLLALSLAAQATAAAGIATPEAGFSEKLNDFASRFSAIEVMQLDMNQSGVDEFLALEAGACTEDVCAWALFAFDGEAVREVASGEGMSVHLEPTEPAGGVLYVDGITWAFDGHQVYPFGDEISTAMSRPPTMGEMATLRAIEDYAELTAADVMAWTFAYMHGGDRAYGHVLSVTAWDHQIGTWGSPYVILDGDGNVVTESFSADYPRIFPDLDQGGFIVVDVYPAGFGIEAFR